jgi:hypothetical protein
VDEAGREGGGAAFDLDRGAVPRPPSVVTHER